LDTAQVTLPASLGFERAGAIVSSVAPGGWAETAGIECGDEILKVIQVKSGGDETLEFKGIQASATQPIEEKRDKLLKKAEKDRTDPSEGAKLAYKIKLKRKYRPIKTAGDLDSALGVTTGLPTVCFVLNTLICVFWPLGRTCPRLIMIFLPG